MILTVVIPVVNCLRYTQLAIASLRSPIPYRVVLIDNASTDGTEAWARSQDVVYVRNSTNIGVAASWNQGLRWAFEHGNLAMLLNNDIELAPDAIERLLTWLDEGCEVVSINPVRSAKRLLTAGRRHLAVLPLDFSGVVLSRRVVERVGWFDEQFWPAYYEDHDYEYRLYRAGVSRGRALDALAVHYGSRTVIEGGVRLRGELARNRDYLASKYGRIPLRTLGRPATPRYREINRPVSTTTSSV